jgi:tRNA (mo5U34)-methyltransferase
MHDDQLERRIAAIEWHHSISLGKGLVTPGAMSSSDYLPATELSINQGESVLDIGARDGYYSFEAERLGASRVVALEHGGWGIDRTARLVYWRRCLDEGHLPDYSKDAREFWRGELPGRRGFDLASQVLNSKVEPLLADFGRLDLNALGKFGIVLFIDGFHRVKDPIRILERVRSVTRIAAVIESEATWIPALQGQPFIEFLGGHVSLDTFGKWYVPTIEALIIATRKVGFRNVEVLKGPPIDALSGHSRSSRNRRGANGEEEAREAAHHYRAAIIAYV